MQQKHKNIKTKTKAYPWLISPYTPTESLLRIANDVNTINRFGTKIFLKKYVRYSVIPGSL